MADPATSTRAPAGPPRRPFLVDPPVHLEVHHEPPPVELGAGAGDLRQDLGHEALTTETGMHGHAQDQVDLAQRGSIAS